MNISNAFKDKAESFAIGYFIRSVEAARYGEKARAFWFSLKGKKSILGFALAAFGGAVVTFPDPAVTAFGATLAVVGTYLARFGLIAKGSDQRATFPEEYRAAAVFALSMITYGVELATAAAGLAMLFGSEGVKSASLTVIMICQGLSTATGYFSTLIGPTPQEAAETSRAAP